MRGREQNAGQVIEESAARLLAWLEAEGYRGYDPYDALSSPFLETFGKESRVAGVAFTQLLRCAPINTRRILRIEKAYNAKGMGLFLATFVRRYAALHEEKDLEHAGFFAEWLRENAEMTAHGVGWGYPFDWASRGGFTPRGMPTIVSTAFAAQALLDYAKVSEAPWAFELARRACEFVLCDLHRSEDASGICFSYTARHRRFVHNANMLGAALLARVGASTGERELKDAARRATMFTVKAQAQDGSWVYGLDARDGWIDNFHTGYVLGALAQVMDWCDCGDWEDALTTGYEFWKNHFFEKDGAPRYFLGARYPIDSHCTGGAVLLALAMRARDSAAASFATKVLLWGIESMQDARGYFWYQKTRLYTNRIPYMRWANAWMLRAQAEWLWGASFYHEDLD